MMKKIRLTAVIICFCMLFSGCVFENDNRQTDKSGDDVTDVPQIPPGDGNTLKIWCVGDSITYGDGGCYRNKIYHVLTNDYGYDIDFIGNRDNIQNPAYLEGFDDYDHDGYSGWQIGGIKGIIEIMYEGGTRPNGLIMEGVKQYDPDLMLIMLGTNNIVLPNSVPTLNDINNYWIRDLKGIVDYIFQKDSNITIILASAPPAPYPNNKPASGTTPSPVIPGIDANGNKIWPSGSRGETGQLYSSAIKTMVESYATGRLLFVNMEKGIPVNQISDDCIHPDKHGYVTIAEVWLEGIAGYLEIRNQQ